MTDVHKATYGDVTRRMRQIGKDALISKGYAAKQIEPAYGGQPIIWVVEDPSGAEVRIVVKTSRNRWFAFGREPDGPWRTVGDVDLVLVAALDDKDRPSHVDIFLFPAEEVIDRITKATEARKAAGMSPNVEFGVFVPVDKQDDQSQPSAIGDDLSVSYPKIWTHSYVEKDATEVPAQEEMDLVQPIEIPERKADDHGLSIHEAKAGLARRFGVAIDQIVIVIRA